VARLDGALVRMLTVDAVVPERSDRISAKCTTSAMKAFGATDEW
jgi:hypothetical protein